MISIILNVFDCRKKPYIYGFFVIMWIPDSGFAKDLSINVTKTS